MYVVVKGFAYVHWTESSSNGSDNDTTESYYAKEKFVKTKVKLIDGGR